MKYQVKHTSPLYKILKDLLDRRIDADMKAQKLAEEYGFEGGRRAPSAIGGGISSFVREDGKCPKGFKKVYKDDVSTKDFYPMKQRHKELHQKIAELPIVRFEEVYALLNYDPQKTFTPDKKKYSPLPGMKEYRRSRLIVVAISIHYKDYKPVPGMMPIGDKTFNQIVQREGRVIQRGGRK